MSVLCEGREGRALTGGEGCDQGEYVGKRSRELRGKEALATDYQQGGCHIEELIYGFQSCSRSSCLQEPNLDLEMIDGVDRLESTPSGSCSTDDVILIQNIRRSHSILPIVQFLDSEKMEQQRA